MERVDGVESLPGTVLPDDLLPLTPAQRGMWFAENLSPDYSVNIAQYVDIQHAPGGFDDRLFTEICELVGKQIQSPYVRITEVDGVPMQYVDLDFDQHSQIIDLREDADPVAAAMTWMEAEYRRPVDLITDQFIVLILLRVADDRVFWYMRSHHIIVDGYAALSILRRIVDHYNAVRRGEQVVDVKPAATMAEIVDYENSYVTGTRRTTDREHWLERVQNLPERVTLSHVPTTAPLSFDNVVVSQALDASLQARLEATAKECRSSMAVVLTAAFSAFLGRMSGTDDIVMSLPVTGRSTAKIKRSGGMVSNILPIRLRDVSAQTVRELIGSAQLEMTGALRHQRYRSEDIKRDAGMDGSSFGFGPRINMVFFDEPIAIDGAEVTYRILTSGILDDLLVNLYQSSPGAPLVVDLHGNPHLYTRVEIESHHRRFLAFVERMLNDLDAGVRDIELLLPGEAADLTALQTGPVRAWDERSACDTDLLALFRARVAEHPDRVAITDDTAEWTYAEFDALRRALGARLVADGVRPGDRVGVVLDRGIEQVVAIYAALTAGGAYVPLDPTSPEGRRRLVLDTAGPTKVIDAEYLAEIGFSAVPGEFGTDGPVIPRAARTAYVIFTSGSTGVPKGVNVSVAAVSNRLAWMQAHYPVGAGDAVLYKTPFTFDVSVGELFWPLQVGARMVIARAGGHRDPAYLRSLIVEREVTNVHFVPSMLDVFVDAATPGIPALPASVRRVFTSGEGLPAGLAHRVVGESDAALINLYGPTEAAVEVTEYQVTGGEHAIPIGRPVPNTRTYVLDAQLRRVPVGIAGELYLAGVQLADGYEAQSALTAERFVADPFVFGERMYRTGDLVRWNVGGDLDYLGRTDFQVKIRGQRVELGEIEATLRGAGSIDGAVVMVRHETGSPAIVAYVRPKAGTPVANLSDALMRWCRRHLPRYMVPSSVVVLDAFPVNTSGKLDRAALPVPTLVLDETVEYVEPETQVQHRLVAVLSELLESERIGLRDNIFTLGADSLIAARLAARLRNEFGVAVSLNDIFDSRDVAELATAIDSADNVGQRLPLHAGTRPARIPVAFAQARIWFINRMDPDAPTYNMPGAVRLGPDIDLPALRTAVLDVVARHEILRTRFPAIDGEPVQEILPVADVADRFAMDVIDCAPGELDATVTAQAARGFDLISEIPFRASVLRSGGDYVLVLVLHHVAGDGASLRPLISDLMAAYLARRDDHALMWEPLAVQYADFAIWQRAVLGEPDDPDSQLSHELAFWQDELSGLPELLALPTDRPRPRTPTGVGAFLDTELSSETAARVRTLAGRLGVTTFSVLHAALAVVLHRLADTDDVAVGTAVAGRDEPETSDLIGMFVNTVVLRTLIDPSLSVAEAVATAHRSRTRALQHSQVPFEQVVDAVATNRSRLHSPLFQVILSMQRDPVGISADDGGLDVLDARVPVAKYDLGLTVIESDAGAPRLALEFCYATDIFDHETIADLSRQFIRVVEAMVADPARPVGRIDIVDDGVLAGLRQPLPGPPGQTLRQLFATGTRSVGRLGPAVSGAGEIISHRLFGARVNQLARDLISRGIGPGDVVAISIPRSPQSVIALAAVATAGAAFVMIDPRHPLDRKQVMVADSDPIVGLTVGEVAELAELDWIVLDSADVELRLAGYNGAAVSDAELVRPAHVADVAYLLYTSGSTGAPKGVSVASGGLASLCADTIERLGLDHDSCVLHVSAPSFDATVLELIMALPVGAELAVADFDTFAGAQLEEFINEHQVTHTFLVPALLDTLDPVRVPTLTTICVGGEALPPDVMRRWVSQDRRVVNIYGPTETTVWVTVDDPYSIDDEITIGRPGTSVGALILDRGLRPLPLGVPGELYISGDRLAEGYRNQPGLTAARFVAHPFLPGARMYRTGDRATLRADGRIEYHGRTDFQLKIRGQRIEPGELDAALLSHPDVRNAVSLGVDGPSGEKVLVAYATLWPGAAVTGESLVAYVTDLLPVYLIPLTVKIVDEFATTAVGKVDRSMLPPIDFTEVVGAFVAPRTQLESVVADIFGQVLGVDRVSVHDSFFDLGGNSLSATKVVARIGAVVDRQVPVRELFEHPTVARLAEYVSGLMAGQAAPPLGPRTRAAVVPVSGVQRSMWLINRADPHSPAYNIAMALRLAGPLDLAALRSAVGDLVRRHETLRTSYPMINGEPSQVISPPDAIIAGLVLNPVPVEGALDEAIRKVTATGFDITTRPPVRLALLRTGRDEYVVVLVIHHISADGASMAPLARDLMTAYASRVAGTSPTWAPLRVQYADYTLWRSERLAAIGADGVDEETRQLDYWRGRLADAPEVITLPTDRARPPVPTFEGEQVPFEVSAELVAGLESVAHAHNTTLFMVTQAAFAVLLGRLAGTTDVVVGTPYVGRGDPALDDVIGMFVNTLALRTTLDSTEMFGSLLERVRTSDLADMANADVAFDEVVGVLGRSRTSAFNPVFQTMFAFQNLDFPTVELAGLEISPVSEELVAAKVDLQLTLFPSDPTDPGQADPDRPMRGELLFATDLFDAATVARHAQRYLRILEQIAEDPSRVVGDISIATPDELSDAQAGAEEKAQLPLPELVASAVAATPDAEAFADGGMTVSFAALSAMATAMAATLPDADSALITALMSLVPSLAVQGPEKLGEALDTLRSNATASTSSTL
ncbi:MULTISPECIES: amino acid adenylation domain-containing protein [Gordonia]|uniref:amino acid adenylation domain-containing protein n=1 Tax=Gordonia TaxID=2053 RepID=UPI001FE35CC6|nr:MULTISPECIES: non-ribosomal peptide synthetase [Gordonia]